MERRLEGVCVFEPKKAEEDTCRVKKVTGNMLLTETFVRPNTQPDFKNQKKNNKNQAWKSGNEVVEVRVIKESISFLVLPRNVYI